MAITNGLLKGSRGSVGNIITKQVDGRTIVTIKNDCGSNPRTLYQMISRMKWANLIRTYKAFDGGLMRAFEDKAPGVNDFNRFMSVNIRKDGPFLRKDNWFTIAAPYQITEGSLDAIEHEKIDDQTIKTNIKIGDLVIDDNTSVFDFCFKISSLNLFDPYDYLSLFCVEQTYSPAKNNHPQDEYRIRVDVFPIQYVYKLPASVQSLCKYKLLNVDGFLGVTGLGSGCYCFVHSRKRTDRTLVSTQELVNFNEETLNKFMTDDALVAAAKSYGCKEPDLEKLAHRRDLGSFAFKGLSTSSPF